MKRVFLILFCCSAFCGYAQQHTLRQYTAIDGLPQSQVNAMLEDAFGYLWVGTNGGGLARFNGKEFKVYNTIDGLLSNTHYLADDRCHKIFGSCTHAASPVLMDWTLKNFRHPIHPTTRGAYDGLTNWETLFFCFKPGRGRQNLSR